MQKDGRDEAEPLVRRRFLVQGGRARQTRVGIWHRVCGGEAAELCKRAVSRIVCSVRAWKDGDCFILDACLVSHTRHVACTHIDKHIGRRTDHRVNVWFGHDW